MTKIVILKIINYVEQRADRSLLQRKVYQEHFYKVSCKSDKYFLKYPDNGVSSARKRKSEKTCPKRRQLFRQQDFTVKKHFEHSVEVTDTLQKWNNSPAPSVNESFVCPRQVVPSILCTSFVDGMLASCKLGSRRGLGSWTSYTHIVSVGDSRPGIMSNSHAELCEDGQPSPFTFVVDNGCIIDR